MVRALNEKLGIPIEWFGMGGIESRRAGVNLLVDSSRFQSHGLVEVLPHLLGLAQAFKTLVHAAEERRPDWAFLVDFQDFHLRLAWKLSRQGIPVVQMVAPTVWAWRENRVSALKERVSKLLVIYPFEEPLWKERGMDASFIGHPLMNSIQITMSREEFLASMNWHEPVRVVGLLPGSRTGEVKRLLPVMLQALEIWPSSLGTLRAFLVPAPTIPVELINAILHHHKGVDVAHIPPERRYNAMANADILLLASGTASLEAALVRTPAVILYRMNPLTWFIARHVVRVPYAGIVNILSRKIVQPELLQDRITPQAILDTVGQFLQNPNRLCSVFDDYTEVVDRLGCLHAFEEGPRIIAEFLNRHGLLPS